MPKIILKLIYLILFLISHSNYSLAEIVKEIKVEGNKRISTQTIILFSKDLLKLRLITLLSSILLIIIISFISS